MNGLPLYIQNRLGRLCRKLNNSSFLCQCQTSKGPTTYWVVFKEQLKKIKRRMKSQGFCKANACRKSLVVMEWNPIFIVHSCAFRYIEPEFPVVCLILRGKLGTFAVLEIKLIWASLICSKNVPQCWFRERRWHSWGKNEVIHGMAESMECFPRGRICTAGACWISPVYVIH